MNTRYFKISLGIVILSSLFNASGRAAGGVSTGGTVLKYTDKAYMTELPWGTRSHWIQPWRAYMDTWPSSRMEHALGVNYRVGNDLASIEPVFKHLAKIGFKYVRLEFGWNNISWDDPSKLTRPEVFEKLLSACKKTRLRPLILLNSNHGIPCPSKQYSVILTQPASKGDTVVHIDPNTLKDAIASRSGLSNLSMKGWGAENLFTQIMPDGTCSLSKALGKDIPAGAHPAMTLKYLPFYPSRDKTTGREPSQFRETMNGWLSYISTISSNAKRVLGTEGTADAGFDVEVWNEMSFGSSFLNINRYYDKPIAQGDYSPEAIIKYSVEYIRDPKNHMPNVGVTDGFESQRPWSTGSSLPAGLTAISKHPYRGMTKYPNERNLYSGKSVDALGEIEGKSVSGRWQDDFIPTYAAFLPEYFLLGLQTESLIRDLAPFDNVVGNSVHSRQSHAVYSTGKSAPPPRTWITEVNIDARGADPGISPEYLQSSKHTSDNEVTPADAEHLKAKSVLRYLSSYVNKGVARIYFFEAYENDEMGLGLMSREFISAVKANRYEVPSDEKSITSPAMFAIQNLLTVMKGDSSVGKPRQISLIRVSEHDNDHFQFAGNASMANSNPNPYPPLYNREVVAFFPFQATKHKFVIPVYVMTRNMLQRYKQNAPNTDITRFDMPKETFRLNIGNVVGSNAKVSLYDPLTGQEAGVHVINAGSSTIDLEAELTDSPRVLVIEEAE